MKKFLLRASIAAAALASVSSAAFSADIDVMPPPPPVEELRPATYDWSGPYVGAFVAGVYEEGHYGKVPDCVPGAPPCPPVDPEMSGNGFAGGVLAGWNYDMDGIVLGVEGDYGWGGKVAQNREPAELTELSYDAIATARARAGIAFDDTLLYVTGGAAFVNMSFSGDVGGFNAEDSQWVTGWTVGGGIEHAFTDNIHARLEYLYMDLPDADFRLEDPNGFGGSVTQQTDDVHMVRAAVTYNFGW
jgi:outer membrane immunogenic protein